MRRLISSSWHNIGGGSLTPRGSVLSDEWCGCICYFPRLIHLCGQQGQLQFCKHKCGGEGPGAYGFQDKTSGATGDEWTWCCCPLVYDSRTRLHHRLRFVYHRHQSFPKDAMPRVPNVFKLLTEYDLLGAQLTNVTSESNTWNLLAREQASDIINLRALQGPSNHEVEVLEGQMRPCRKVTRAPLSSKMGETRRWVVARFFWVANESHIFSLWNDLLGRGSSSESSRLAVAKKAGDGVCPFLLGLTFSIKNCTGIYTADERDFGNEHISVRVYIFHTVENGLHDIISRQSVFHDDLLDVGRTIAVTCSWYFAFLLRQI